MKAMLCTACLLLAGAIGGGLAFAQAAAAPADVVQEVIDAVEKECLEGPGYVYTIGHVKAKRLAELVRERQPRLVVECGTALGYSGLWIARELKAAGRGGRLVTIEIDPALAKRAEANFRKAGLSDVITVRVGDARKVVQEIEGPVDFAFIDCNGENYLPVLRGLQAKLAPGAVIVADNTGVSAGQVRGYLDAVRARYTSREEWFDVNLPWCKRDAMEISIVPKEAKMDVIKTAFGQTAEGRAVDLYTLRNASGLTARVMTYGATLIGVDAPDRNGQFANVTLYLDTLDDYLAGHPSLGSTIGRYANRIGDAKFTLDGREYRLAANNGKNHLHGGPKGLGVLVWKAEPVRGDNAVGVALSLVSPDGDEGYPGTLNAKVTYRLTNDNELRIEYEATTDKPTVVNLTNHAYWNLGGAGSGDVLDHVMTLAADRYLEVDEGLTPTGRLLSVKGTPLDFTTPQAIGARIAQAAIGGYDHCFVLNKAPGALERAARVEDPDSGRVMEVFTTEPSVQVYTAIHLSDKLRSRSGAYGKSHAVCLEAQHYPDSPNKPSFPSTVLRPGETYRQTTIHKFGVKK